MLSRIADVVVLLKFFNGVRPPPGIAVQCYGEANSRAPALPTSTVRSRVSSARFPYFSLKNRGRARSLRFVGCEEVEDVWGSVVYFDPLPA